MSDTVDLPAVGRVPRTYLYVGLALVAGIAGYAWWRAGTAAPVDVPAYTEEDIADVVTDAPMGAPGGPANSGGASHDSSTTPDTDAEWVRQAGEMLGSAYDGSALYEALGAYVTRQPLTADQARMVRAAIGAVGYPPGGRYPIDTATGATPSALTAPAGVRVTGATTSTVTLAWDRVPGADGYRIYRSGAPVAESLMTSATVRGLTAGQSHSLTVAARTLAGATGPMSAPVSAKTTAVKLTRPTVRYKSATRTTITVTWSKVTGAGYYRIYVDGVAHGAADGGLTSYTIRSLRPGTAYRISVRPDTTTAAPGPESAKVTMRTKK